MVDDKGPGAHWGQCGLYLAVQPGKALFQCLAVGGVCWRMARVDSAEFGDDGAHHGHGVFRVEPQMRVNGPAPDRFGRSDRSDRAGRSRQAKHRLPRRFRQLNACRAWPQGGKKLFQNRKQPGTDPNHRIRPGQCFSV